MLSARLFTSRLSARQLTVTSLCVVMAELTPSMYPLSLLIAVIYIFAVTYELLSFFTGGNKKVYGPHESYAIA
jgi:hypothetical protein